MLLLAILCLVTAGIVWGSWLVIAWWCAKVSDDR